MATIHVGTKVRATNPKATPRYTVLAVGNRLVKLWNPFAGKAMKLSRARIERVNGLEA